MVGGALVGEEPSPGKMAPRWIGQPAMQHDGSPSLWCVLGWPVECLCRYDEGVRGGEGRGGEGRGGEGRGGRGGEGRGGEGRGGEGRGGEGRGGEGRGGEGRGGEGRGGEGRGRGG